MKAAVAHTGLDDFGDIPFREALEMFVESLLHEANLDGAAADGAAGTILRVLVKRLRLVDDRKRCPGIADEVIAAPIVIVGLPRTGSTHLHALLGQIEGLRSPRFWEMMLPSPPPAAETSDTDPRIDEVEAELAQTPAELQRRHPFSARRPEQCNMLYDWSFINQAWLASWNIPAYRDWLFDADYRPALETHRRTLQHLQWRHPGRWVLKYPKHLIALDVLLDTYPDAVLVWTHRDPAVVLPSVTSLTGFMREMTCGPMDRQRFGRGWALMDELVLHRGVGVRERMADADSRVIDVHYRDLMTDQIGTIERILTFAGVSFAGRSRTAIERFIAENPRDRHGRHDYAAEDYGFDADRLRRRFRWYIERFDVQLER